MQTTTNPISTEAPLESLPLTLPEELWSKLDEPAQARYRQAQEALDVLAMRGVAAPHTLCQALGVEADELLAIVRLLEGMSLVAVDVGPTVKLLALPDEHVRVVGPDGKVRWIFVARPMVAPDVDPATLN